MARLVLYMYYILQNSVQVRRSYSYTTLLRLWLLPRRFLLLLWPWLLLRLWLLQLRVYE